MSKAQTIDRLEYTRRRFAKQLGLDEPQQEVQPQKHKAHKVEHGRLGFALIAEVGLSEETAVVSRAYRVVGPLATVLEGRCEFWMN